MEDKEKQKEDWTSLSLTIAVIVFVAVGYLTFIAFLSTKPENEALVEWFLKFMDKYGAFLAAIPVMIGVAVAKQQLDANRRQHVAQIKRGLREELEALDKLLKWAQITSNSTMETASNGIFFEYTHRLHIFTHNADEIEQWKGHLPIKLHQLASTFFDDISSFNTRVANTKYQINFATDELGEIIKLAKEIQKDADSHYTYLSQYWS